jgi:hypothetical protein
MKKVNKKEHNCIFLFHEDFPNQELYAIKRWVSVSQEGPAGQYFFDEPLVEGVETVVEQDEEEGVEIPREINLVGLRNNASAEDMALLRAEGFDIDDDNEPAPENIPDLIARDGTVVNNDQQEWGWSGIDNRKSNGGGSQHGATLVGFNRRETDDWSILRMFKYLLPMMFLEYIVLKRINQNIKGRPVVLGEFLRWIGIWFYMSTFIGYSQDDYWSTADIEDFSGAPVRFHEWMSKRRFNAILAAIEYTDKEPPPYKDQFHYVHQLIAAWNENMARIFIASWVSCLDESMSPWTSRWTCPGWMFVPRKPHPMGNEYHSICCGLSGIMYTIELVEGKDEPAQKPRDETNTKGKTVGLRLRLTKSIVGRGMVVILDSGFCVLQGLIELWKVGIFASAVIKKRRYWPKYVPGDDMDRHMEGKPIGSTDSLHGTLDGIPYDLFIMKDKDYNMKLMSTYGSLVDQGEEKRRVTDDGETIHTSSIKSPSRTTLHTGTLLMTTTTIDIRHLFREDMGDTPLGEQGLCFHTWHH